MLDEASARQELRRLLDSPEQRFQDPTYSAKRRQADLSAVESHISSCLGLKLADLLAGNAQLPLPHPKPPPAGLPSIAS